MVFDRDRLMMWPRPAETSRVRLFLSTDLTSWSDDSTLTNFSGLVLERPVTSFFSDHWNPLTGRVFLDEGRNWSVVRFTKETAADADADRFGSSLIFSIPNVPEETHCWSDWNFVSLELETNPLANSRSDGSTRGALYSTLSRRSGASGTRLASDDTLSSSALPKVLWLRLKLAASPNGVSGTDGSGTTATDTVSKQLVSARLANEAWHRVVSWLTVRSAELSSGANSLEKKLSENWSPPATDTALRLTPAVALLRSTSDGEDMEKQEKKIFLWGVFYQRRGGLAMGTGRGGGDGNTLLLSYTLLLARLCLLAHLSCWYASLSHMVSPTNYSTSFGTFGQSKKYRED
ncbi:hypothetical protein OGAPHI_002784 [Ogataea philodendri]|uniref:Uncharacterized protein n=1 Tax=Ogataea philodendri TaxID=1378263 RepID=A0A9P8P8U4_9ASCO|nr:uncharacterized protein OGAPHI_002784 [Ogataea philodendri]KAH3667135.1 hypothetical protein OGAPHI_002784 [Ogataea philodendri]